MNSPPQTEATTDNTSGFPEVYFGRTSDGLFAALVGENAFAMIPAYNGEHYLGHPGSCLCPSPNGSSPASMVMAASSTARRRSVPVSRNAEHQRQLRRLARRSIPARQATPWGLSDHATRYADGFYEEDCCWAAVAQAFPDLFTDFEKRCAEETIQHWYPDAWPRSLTSTPGRLREATS